MSVMLEILLAARVVVVVVDTLVDTLVVAGVDADVVLVDKPEAIGVVIAIVGGCVAGAAEGTEVVVVVVEEPSGIS